MSSASVTFVVPAGLLEISETITEELGRKTGQGAGFSWETRLTPAGDGWWSETLLTTDRALHFDPSLIVWLGALDNLNDRQAHTWRQTILRAPTSNQAGLGGNDLPAGYVWDHDLKLETILYVPPDGLKWSPQRFYELAIREVIEYRPQPRYGLGLIPSVRQPNFTFEPGEYQFRVWVRQTKMDDMPDPWQAQARLIDAITPLLETVPALLPEAPGWQAMAQGSLSDLEHEACWVTAAGRTGLRAYVRGSSAVGRDQAAGFELMTQLDVLLPLLHWREYTGETRADGVIERLLDAVRSYRIIEPHHYLPNHYPYGQTDTFMDTWYFYENALIKLPWVAWLTDDSDFREQFLTALEGGRELARKTGYLIPLFADAQDWSGRGSLLNSGVSGMYAAACVLAHQLTGSEDCLAEAAAALRTIHQLPPHLLTHEPQQLSFAAAAAAYLGEAVYARDFVNLSLRMGYWGRDPGASFYDPRGMFQACASLCYPAYKENVEVIWPWAELLAADDLRSALPAGVMSAFANLQRCHNYHFFDPFLPPSLRRGPCPYIPYEDLATTEFTHTAALGKELYGAGEVFWSALLFRRPAMLSELPDDILTLSLAVPCLRLSKAGGGSSRWLIYNPRLESVSVPGKSEIILEPQSYLILEG